MAEAELRCNFKHCRKAIEGMAWVTACSHVFCDEDGEKHFTQSLSCPSCNSSLSLDSDLFRTNLKPSDSYKSMILAGQRPEVIVDVVSRALNFWNYQMIQEKVYQEWVAKKLREQLTSVESQYQGMIIKLQTDSESLKFKMTNMSKDLEEMQKRYDDVAEKYNEKVRQYQTLSTNYEALRRKMLTPNIYGPSAHPQNYQVDEHKRALKAHANLGSLGNLTNFTQLTVNSQPKMNEMNEMCAAVNAPNSIVVGNEKLTRSVGRHREFGLRPLQTPSARSNTPNKLF